MSEEEKKAIETVESFIKYYKTNEQTGNRANLDVFREECQAIEFILNKYDVTQKELNNLKEIEKAHQEENGKLRVELEQEKRISEYWQDRFLEQVKYGNKITVSGDPVIIKNVIDTVTYDYIHKDKIKEEIRELEQQIAEFKEYAKDSKGQEKTYWRRELAELVGARNSLRGLLEEK